MGLEGIVPQEIVLNYDWDAKLQDGPSGSPVFVAKGIENGKPAKFVLKTTVRKKLGLNPKEWKTMPSIDISGVMTDFQIHLIPSAKFVEVGFDKISFRSVDLSTPKVDTKIADVKFGEQLGFIAKIAEALSPDTGFFIDLQAGKLLAGFRFAIPNITAGGFNLIQLSFNTSVVLPFNGDKVRLRFAVSERNKPFIVSVGVFGGGGFMALEMTTKGVVMIEGSLEYGAVVALSLGPANGTAYVMGGIYFSTSAEVAVMTGFVRAGANLDVAGLVRIACEFYLGLSYERRGDESWAVGEASLTVDIEIGWFEVSYRLTMRREYMGSKQEDSSKRLNAAAVEESDLASPNYSSFNNTKEGLEDWAQYRRMVRFVIECQNSKTKSSGRLSRRVVISSGTI